MKNFIYTLLIILGIINSSCDEKIDNNPIFKYDCTDTAYFYNANNELTHRNIRYTKNGLFAKSIDLNGNETYINYDSKNRIIKEGSIYYGEHAYTEYVYGIYDTISEVKYSDNRRNRYFYNTNRKKTEARYYDNNLLTYTECFEYFYFTDIEMVKSTHNSELLGYSFNIKNTADIPVNLDTIENYNLWYMSRHVIDSMLIFDNQELITKSVYLYNLSKLPIYEEYTISRKNYKSRMIRKWEYTASNMLKKFIEEYTSNYFVMEDYYREQRNFYNNNDELVKIEFYSSPEQLSAYANVSRNGLNRIIQWFNPNDDFLGSSEYTPACLENIKSSSFKERASDFPLPTQTHLLP